MKVIPSHRWCGACRYSCTYDSEKHVGANGGVGFEF